MRCATRHGRWRRRSLGEGVCFSRNRISTATCSTSLGLWQFQLDPKEDGEAAGRFKELPAPRPIAVPCSWNDLFDNAKNYLGLAWYHRELSLRLDPQQLARTHDRDYVLLAGNPPRACADESR